MMIEVHAILVTSQRIQQSARLIGRHSSRFFFSQVWSRGRLLVAFPAFATSYVHDRARTAHLFGRGLKYVFLLLLPLTLVTVALAPEGLTLWLGPDFAQLSQNLGRSYMEGRLGVLTAVFEAA